MRILHVLSTLNIGSGIANFAVNHYREIVNHGIQFDFLVFKKMPNDFYDDVVKLGARVFYIEQPTLNIGKYKKRVKKFFAEHKGEWEIVHIHEILVQRFIAKSAKKYGGVKKAVIHCHAAQFVSPETGKASLKSKIKYTVKKLRNKYLLSGVEKNCDYYFACSYAAGRALYSDKAIDGNKFYLAKNSINADNYIFDQDIRNKYRAELNIADKKVIAVVGRLSQQKNILFLLDVFKKIVEKDNSYRLLLIGDGEIRTTVEQKISELEIGDEVILTGNRSDVASLLMAADLFVLPSLAEGLGIVLIEAQAAGLPCVKSDGVPDEAVITPYVKTLALDDSVDKWAQSIVDIPLDRYDGSIYVRDAKYDIRQSAAELATKYRAMVEEA